MMSIYICEKCGKIVDVVRDSQGELSCCNQPMTKLTPNASEASKAKHVPFVQTVNGNIVAKVGAEPHPMEENHHIEWIAATDGKETKYIMLKPGDKPEAVFTPCEDCVVYAYCNLHGLWKTNFS